MAPGTAPPLLPTRRGGSIQSPALARPHGPCQDPRCRPEGSTRAVPGSKMADTASASPPPIAALRGGFRTLRTPHPKKKKSPRRQRGKYRSSFYLQAPGAGAAIAQCKGRGRPRTPSQWPPNPPRGGAEGVEMEGGTHPEPPSPPPPEGREKNHPQTPPLRGRTGAKMRRGNHPEPPVSHPCSHFGGGGRGGVNK